MFFFIILEYSINVRRNLVNEKAVSFIRRRRKYQYLCCWTENVITRIVIGIKHPGRVEINIFAQKISALAKCLGFSVPSLLVIGQWNNQVQIQRSRLGSGSSFSANFFAPRFWTIFLYTFNFWWVFFRSLDVFRLFNSFFVSIDG